MTTEHINIVKKLILTAACVIMNMGGDALTDIFELPFWLDTIGTALAACAFGPVYGGAAGLITNLILGISDSLSAVYAAINAGIGIVIGICARKGICGDLFGALFTGVIAGFFTVICAVPINCIFYGGYIGNKWGDALFELLSSCQIDSIIFKSACAQAILDIPDKVISIFIAFMLIKLLTKAKILPKKTAESEK